MYTYRITQHILTVLCCLFLLAACGGGGSTDAQPEATRTVAESSPLDVQPTADTRTVSTSLPTFQPTAVEQAVSTSAAEEDIQLDACSLLDQADLEDAVGREVLAPKNEQLANLACCSYGDPETPIFSVATVCVFIGSETGYYAGAEAQAQDVFELAKKNAASATIVSGLGEDAYWDEAFGDLHILQGRYEIEISLEVEDGIAAQDASQELAQKVLQNLP